VPGYNSPLRLCRMSRTYPHLSEIVMFEYPLASFPATISSVIAAGGRPLEPDVREFMEKAFGCSFVGVRIHDNALAAESARLLQARAWNAGNHIAFAAGQYQPSTLEGITLLAHELAHVVQCSEPSTAPCTEWLLGDCDFLLEAEADRSAQRVAMGFPASPLHRDAPACVVRKFACPRPPIWNHLSAGPQTVWLPANQAIEAAYRAARPTNSVLFGSEFITGADIRLPSGAPNKAFGNKLLADLRGLQAQLRPDIIDFDERVFYEIKTEENAIKEPEKVKNQLLHYYKLAETIRVQFGPTAEPEWTHHNATWKPPEQLPFPSDALGKIVCTAATDYGKWPTGLVLYEVLQKDQQAENALKQLADAYQRLFNLYALNSKDHQTQFDLYNRNIFGFWTNRLFNKEPPPPLIWNNAYGRLLATKALIEQQNIPKATAELAIARLYYLWAYKKYTSWKDGIEAAGAKMQGAIVATALVLIFTAVAVYAAGVAAAGTAVAGEASTAQMTLVRVAALCADADKAIQAAQAEVEVLDLIEKAEAAAAALP
jgi:hypothetical protein